jgi:hypothetical protein
MHIKTLEDGDITRGVPKVDVFQLNFNSTFGIRDILRISDNISILAFSGFQYSV